MAQSGVSEYALSHLLIRASAGTGKTYQLASRYLGLLFSGTEVDEILATTFTRKAAGEILTRVLRWVAEAAVSDEARRELAGAVGRPSLTGEDCLSQLRRLAQRLHRIRIATLDSFFINLASGFELELGLPPNWSICDPVDEPALRAEALTRMLRGREADAVEWMHLLAKGAAKRGVHRLLLNTIEQCHSIFGETTAEVWHVFKAPPGLTPPELEAAITCLEHVLLPANKSLENAHQKAVEAARNDNWSDFVGAGIAKKILEQESTYYGKPIDKALIDAYGPLIQHAASVLISEVAWQTEAAYQLLKRFDQYFHELRSERGVVRFADVPPAIVTLMSHTNDQRLAYRMGGRINHLLLDEFQDTSLVQWRSLESISRRIVSQPPVSHSLFCVGDTKQAIYGWRGGMVEIFDHLETQLQGLSRQSLTASFRSSPAVIEMVNRVFSGMTRHNHLEDLEPGVHKWCEGFQSHSTHRSELPGYACLMTTRQPSQDAPEEDVILDETVALVETLWQSAPGQSIAVLTRANEPIGKLIYRLRQRGIAASEEGGNPLTDSAAVQLVLSLLQLADHPADAVAQFHLAHSPLGAYLDWTPDCVGRRDRAVALSLRTRRRLVSNGYGACIADWANALQPSCTRREWDRLQQCVELAYRYDERATLRAVDFIELVRTQRIADPTSAPVRVMTIHQAKGLEFDIVVFSELSAGLRPSNKDFAVAWDCATLRATHVTRYVGREVRALMPEPIQKVYADCLQRDVGEALCVLYVALTRAKHALYLLTTPRGYTSKNNVQHLKTYAGLLHAALVGEEPMLPQSIVAAWGDPEWYRQLPRASTALPERSAGAAANVVAPLPRLAPATAARVRGLQTVSPSSLEGGAALRVHDMLQSDRSAALERGTLIHAWLETIGWLDAEPVDRQKLLAIAERHGVLNPRQAQQALREFLEMLDQRALRGLLSRAGYQRTAGLPWAKEIVARLQAANPEWQVKRETRVVSRDGDRLVVGNIDRLVIARSDAGVLAADVIDFKTDTIDRAGQLKERVAYYRPQLEAYRQAVASMLRLPADCVVARLVFVPEGKIVVIA